MDDGRPNPESDPVPDSPAAVLAFARVRRAEADRAEAELLEAAVAWAVMHPAESVEEAETVHLRGFGDTAIPVAGPGAPLVAEFSVAEFAAAVGLPTEAGKRYVGQAVELRYRLPRVWARVTKGDLAAWRARRVAEQTIRLSPQAAGFVDRHVAPVAHKTRPSQVDRLVEEAIGRFMPAEAEARRRDACDGRRFDTRRSRSPAPAGSSGSSTSPTRSTSTTPSAPARSGWPPWVPPRASRCAAPSPSASSPAATSPSTSPAPATPRTSARNPPRRPCHGARARAARRAARARTARWCCTCICRIRRSVAAVMAVASRWGGWRTPGCRSPAEHVSVHAYEVPDRIIEPVVLRDVTCVFPWCTRPARGLGPDQHPCDRDHVIPHHRGGPTCACSIAPLCRRHHRLKTHGGWTYYVLEPGTYVWTSPHGYQFLRDHTGTLDVSRDRHRGAPPADT